MNTWVKVKAVLAALGLALGLAGMALETRPLVVAAIGLLGAAFLVRFFEPRANPPPPRG